MGKNKSASGLINVINYDNFGNISFVSGSTTLMQVSSSGVITTTGTISGSSVESASLAQNSDLLQGTGSVGFTTTSSFTTMSSSLSSRTTQIESVYATTGSNSFRATQSITGSLTVTGQIIAQTINVQQVTSSIIYSSGSNVFGCDINSRQVFTGSFYQTGSNAYFSNCVAIGVGNFPVTGAVDIRNTIQPSKQISLNTQCGSGTYLGLYTDQESFFNLTNSSACANNKVWRIGTPAATPNVLTIQNLNDAGTSICGTPMTISACGRVTVCNTLGAAAVDLNPIFACPTNAAVGYGMFGFSGIGLGIASAGTGANQGIAFFTCGDFERLRITSGGVSCFSGTICAPNLISTDATHTTLRMGCAIVPLTNYRTSDCGYGGIDFFDNGKGYACAAKFYTFKSVSTAEYYGLTNDYNGSAQLALISCGGGAGNNISFFTGTSATAKMRIDNNATCITCQLSVGPSITIGNQGGTDTTVIGGGSGVGSLLRMNYAGGSYNNYLAGNGDNYFNCLLGKLNAAGGVKYGGGATTLNYYEQGSWTPELQNASVSYSNRSGTYVRIGDYVFVRWGFRISSISGQSGTVTISGLPFTSVSWGSYQEPNISVSTGALATADNAQRARIFVGGSSTSLFGRIANNADTTWNTSDLQNGSWIIGEIFYNVP
jgi:hypothetical protein